MICGNGIGLRPVLEEDLLLLGEWRSDPLTQSMFYSPFLWSDTALQHWFKALLGDSNRIRFMVQRLEDNATIGIVGLEHIQPRNQEAELAGLVIAPSERNRGWAAKAVSTLIVYAFQDLNLHRLYARIYAPNKAGLRVAEMAGMRCEGVARQAVFYNWHYEDVLYWSLLREEWQNDQRKG